LPIGFCGFIFYPDFPETTKAFYITPVEQEFACARLLTDGLAPLGAAKWDRTKIFRIMSHWQFWLLPLGYFLVQGSFPSYQPVYALWLKATKHTVYEANVWPTGQIAVGVVVQILAGMLSDSPLLRGKRWQAIVAMQSLTIFSTIVLATWNVPTGLKYVAYYLMYSSAGVPGVYYAWYSDLIAHDHEMRGFVIACSNMFSYIQSIWFTIVVWRTVDGPQFHKGFIFASVLGCALCCFCVMIRQLEKRMKRKRAHEDEEDSNGAIAIGEEVKSPNSSVNPPAQL
jgi:MFS transporter, ACS family, pantothenate transporter